uniref:Uncharacterized protein n=1 Tax=viral metagenome TaxID=1070528 RepID=A0A6M3KLD5_9ZZZZ
MLVSNSIFEAIAYNEGIVAFRRDPKVPFIVSMPLGQVISKLRPYADVYFEEKQKIVDKYCDKDEKGEKIIKDNKVTFSTSEQAQGFTREINALMRAKTDISSVSESRVRINLEGVVSGLCVDDMIALSDIVEFINGSNIIVADSVKSGRKR